MSTQSIPAYPQQITDEYIRVTDAAREKLGELLSAAEDEVNGIRIFVSGGGCSGMTYGMTYADNANAHDSVLEGEGFKVLVDPIALNYLQGCEIDFARSGANATFVFNNVFKSVGGSGTCGGCGGGGGGGCG
jgi:iron-sulfur cluster assembly accessory protein